MSKRVITATLATSLALCVASIYIAIGSPRRGLNRFLDQVTTVEIGRTSLEDWRGQLERAHLSNVDSACDQDTCNVSWQGQNRLLHKLRLAPLSTVKVTVVFKGGTASEIYIWAEIDDALDAGGAMQPGTGATVHQASGQSCNEHYATDVKQHGSRRWAVVTMDSCVERDERARALAVNSACLTAIGGCRTAEAIVPRVFGNHK